MTSSGGGPLHLSEGPEAPPAKGLRASWTECLVDSTVVSIPAAVERWAVELREEYLRWVYELGLQEVRGRTIRSRLRLRSGLSYWWMTLIPEKASLKTPNVYAAFKLAALRREYEERGCIGIVNQVPDRNVHRVLRTWCRELGHPYQWKPAPAMEGRSESPVGRAWRRRPHWVRALESFRQRHDRLRVVRHCPRLQDSPARFPDEVTIVTYFPNVDREAAERGEFRSKYWGALHGLLDSLPVTVNWVWIYIDSDDCSFENAVRLRDRYNATDPGKNRYFLLEEFAADAGGFTQIATFLAIFRRGLGLRGAGRHFRMGRGGPPLFPLFRSDWRSSFFGTVAADAAYFLTAFDGAARRLPGAKWGMYLWEEQPWEIALLHAWERWSPATRTVGFQHSSFGPMLLRMFDDPRRYVETGGDAKPSADVLAVNGPSVRALMEETGFPRNRLADVEAVRYLYLADAQLQERARQNGVERTLLAVGSFQPAEVRFLLQLLRGAAEDGALDGYARIVLKAHPFWPIVESDLEGIAGRVECEITSIPLQELWSRADAVLAANSTTAALEALSAGLPVAVCSAGDAMNLSALFGHPSVPMVNGRQELARFLGNPGPPADPAGLFHLDLTLRRWRELLDPQAAVNSTSAARRHDLRRSEPEPDGT